MQAPPPSTEISGRPRFDVRLSRAVVLYVSGVGAVSLAVTVLFLFRGGALPLAGKLAFAAWFIASLGGLGGVLEGRRWAPGVEVLRLAALPLALSLL